VFSDKAGGKISTTEKRYLASFPTIFTPEMRLAPGIKSGLENWINDNTGFRTQMKKLQIDIDFRVFHVSPSSLVHIGKGGWYYYTGNNDLEIALGTYPITPDLLEKIKVNQERIQQALKKKGIDYVIVFTPSKGSVYPEYLGGGNFIVRETAIDVISDYLRKNTTIPIINTKPDLLQAKKSEVVYFKTDAHWNEAGAYIGYRLTINTLNKLGMIHSSPIDISTMPSTINGEFSDLMGDADLLAPEPYEATQITSPNAVKIESGDYNKIQALMQSDNLKYYFFSYQNMSAEKKKLLVYGDSFFASWKIRELLAENFSEFDYIWSYDVRNNVLEQIKPDIFILEVAERYMVTTLTAPPDPALINEP